MTTIATIGRGVAATALAGTMAFAVFGLSGCVVRGSGDAQRIAELERQVAELQEQAQDQGSQDQGSSSQGSSESGSASSGSSQGQSGSNAGTGGDSNPNAGSGGASAVEITDATVQDFASRAETLIAEASAAQVPADRSALISTYFDFDQRFDALDDEMDRYDDQKELEQRNGVISWDEYRAIKLQLDMIEDDLDRASDELEWRFGIDD